MATTTKNLLLAAKNFKEAGLTEGSALLLAELVIDAPNWNGSPMLDVDDVDKGHLTDLKKKGLLRTSFDGDTGTSYVFFSDKGKAFITSAGFSDFIS